MPRKSESSNFGILVILIGVVILLMNFNILNLSMFWGIVHLWPLLLVILGLTIIFKNQKNIGIILWLLFFGVVISYSYLNMEEKTWFLGEDVENVQVISKDKFKSNSGSIDIDIKHGSIEISPSDTGISYNIPEDSKEKSFINTGLLKPAEIKIKDNSKSDKNIKLLNLNNRKYEVFIPKAGNWTLKIDGGVIDGSLDLTEVSLKEFYLDYGVGDIELLIGEKSEGDYKVDFGIGDFTMVIPNDIGVKIKVDTGINTVDISEKDFSKSGNVYTSKNYKNAKYQINLDVNIGIGSIDINYK